MKIINGATIVCCISVEHFIFMNIYTFIFYILILGEVSVFFIVLLLLLLFFFKCFCFSYFST